MSQDREQAIKDVAEETMSTPEKVEMSIMLHTIYAIEQRERVIALERVLRNLEHIVTELYPGDVEPDAEHLGEYQAVWSAVMNARAALGDH